MAIYAYHGPLALCFPPDEPEVERKFDPGLVNITVGATKKFVEHGVGLMPYLKRHLQGDWGDRVEMDSRLYNDEAATYPHGSIVSRYETPLGELVIRTFVGFETTLLLPEEY